MPSTPPKSQSPEKQSPVAGKRQSQLSRLLKFDQALLKHRSPACHLIGLDEVGRGSLISSVVGGAVCLPRQLTPSQKRLLHWLNDSKKLTPALRAELSEGIHSFCWTGIGEASLEEIQALNIHYASLLSLYRALEQLCQQAGLSLEQQDLLVVMDGRATIPDLPADMQMAIVKGDGSSAAIAAASIIAKHHRDLGIQRLSEQYPGYGWEVNMGYPTPAHLAGIQTLGVTPLHRKTFKKVHEQLALPLNA